MKVPVGVINLLGSGEVPEKIKKLVNGLVKADTDDTVTLDHAYVPKDGKASDIIRIFEGDLPGTDVGISNADFGLLEKADRNLVEVEIEESGDDFIDGKYLLILDNNDEVIGYIQGIKNYK